METLFRRLIEEILSGSLSFYLPRMYEAIASWNQQANEKATFADFEYFLIHQSGLSLEQEMQVRAKIVGKYLPRHAYQVFFPIGSGQVYSGSLIVTAHKSPDTDTVVASFLGWLDAFGAKVSSGLHRWNIPSSPEKILEVQLLFLEKFGPDFFSIFADFRQRLTLRALDLARCDQLMFHTPKDFLSVVLDKEESFPHLHILVNEEGHYLGDLSSEDLERIRGVTDLFNHYLRYTQNELFLLLVSEKPTLLPEGLIQESDFYRSLSFGQQALFDLYLKEISGFSLGIKGSIKDFLFFVLEGQSFLVQKIEQTLKAPFGLRDLGVLFQEISSAFRQVRQEVDRLASLLAVKEVIFKEPSFSVEKQTTLEEISLQLTRRSYFTVVDGHKRPIGVIEGRHLQTLPLGYVAFRDFANEQEIGKPSYLQLLSVLDHHRLSLELPSIGTVIAMDAQSSNIILANCYVHLNQYYPFYGETLRELTLPEMQASSLSEMRLFSRYLQRRQSQFCAPYWVSKERVEYEYELCLYAAMDDTDLLSKNTEFDRRVFIELLNRLASLRAGEEVEVWALEETKPLIQSEELYRYYGELYRRKELAIDQDLLTGDIFYDVKRQEKALVGQVKLYNQNISLFLKEEKKLFLEWLGRVKEEILSLMIFSTLPAAQELYRGREVMYGHQDQLWIFCSNSEEGFSQLSFFLSSFSAIERKGPFRILCHPRYSDVVENTFRYPCDKECTLSEEAMILYYPVGTIRSRKKEIAPLLMRQE